MSSRSTAFKEWAAQFMGKITDLEFEAVETFQNEDGSRVASRWRITGKNNGMLGTAADQRPITLTGTAVWAVREDGKLLHNWVERSSWELFQRLTEKVISRGIGSGPQTVREPEQSGVQAVQPLALHFLPRGGGLKVAPGRHTAVDPTDASKATTSGGGKRSDRPTSEGARGRGEVRGSNSTDPSGLVTRQVRSKLCTGLRHATSRRVAAMLPPV